MTSSGERTFREYAISPYGYETMAASAVTGEGAGNSAQSDNISEDSHSENSDTDWGARSDVLTFVPGFCCSFGNIDLCNVDLSISDFYIIELALNESCFDRTKSTTYK